MTGALLVLPTVMVARAASLTFSPWLTTSEARKMPTVVGRKAVSYTHLTLPTILLV